MYVHIFLLSSFSGSYLPGPRDSLELHFEIRKENLFLALTLRILSESLQCTFIFDNKRITL